MPHIARLSLIAAAVVAMTSAAAAEMISFDARGTAGSVPRGFIVDKTGGGMPANWQIANEPDAPSGGQVVAQVSAGQTDMRYPLLVYVGQNYKDAELSVQFKPVSGNIGQAAGLVWRYQDAKNYYVVRADALANTVVVSKVQDGQSSDLPVQPVQASRGGDTDEPLVRAETWNVLGVTVNGPRFSVSINGRQLYEVVDTTFKDPGNVGLWTKADSVTLFDNLRIERTDLRR